MARKTEYVPKKSITKMVSELEQRNAARRNVRRKILKRNGATTKEATRKALKRHP